MVPKHRRSETHELLASVGAPANQDEFWPEAVRNGQTAATAGRGAVHGRVGPAGNGYSALDDYNAAAAEPGWVAAVQGYSWQEWEGWQDWGPPPVLHPDHPSAPVPRIQLPADHPSGPLPAQRAPTTSGRTGARSRSAPGSQDPLRPLPVARDTDGPGSPGFTTPPPGASGRPRSWGRHAAFTTTATVGYFAADQRHQDVSGFQRQPGPAPREGVGYQRQPGLPRRESTSNPRQRVLPRHESAGYQRPADRDRQEIDYGPLRPGPGRFQNGSSPNGDSQPAAGQALTRANGQAAHIAQRAHDDAAAIREAAERDAAAIREAAELEAAETRSRLDSMLSELSRVAAYITDGLAAPAMPATAPALPGPGPDLPGARSDPPGARRDLPGATDLPSPALPITKPAIPDNRTGTRGAGPPRPRTSPTKKAQKRPRQQRSMRIATYGTAALVAVSLIFGAAEIGTHGLKFFVFRESGQGQSTDGPTDQQFLAQQTAAHNQAPKGRHHKTPPQQTVKATTKG